MDYVIQPKVLSPIEQKVQDWLFEMIKSKPLVWQLVHDKVFNDSSVTYCYQNVFIINIHQLSTNTVINVFEVCQSLLSSHLVTKVIKKREFLIIHFQSNEIMPYFYGTKIWLALITYYLLKQHDSSIKCYFQPTICTEQLTKQIDLAVEMANCIYLITTDKLLPPFLFRHRSVYLGAYRQYFKDERRNYLYWNYDYMVDNYDRKLKNHLQSLKQVFIAS